MSMSQSRFNRIISGMNTAPRKVYDVIPIVDCWDFKQIVAEIRRGGGNSDMHLVAGCVAALVRAGLVNEVGNGKFRREEIKAVISKPILLKDKQMPPATPAKSASATKAAAAQVKTQLSPMDVLGALAARAANIATLVKDLSSDISDAAVEIQSGLESNEDDMLKFKQLQSLLKSIG